MVPISSMKLRTPSSTKEHEFLDLAAFRSPPYLLFCIAVFFGVMSIYVTCFFIELYALEKTNTDPSLASYLLSVASAAFTVGRLIPYFFAGKTDLPNVQITFAIVLATLYFVWSQMNTTVEVLVFCLLYRFFCGVCRGIWAQLVFIRACLSLLPGANS